MLLHCSNFLYVTRLIILFEDKSVKLLSFNKRVSCKIGIIYNYCFGKKPEKHSKVAQPMLTVQILWIHIILPFAKRLNFKGFHHMKLLLHVYKLGG